MNETIFELVDDKIENSWEGNIINNWSDEGKQYAIKVDFLEISDIELIIHYYMHLC